MTLSSQKGSSHYERDTQIRLSVFTTITDPIGRGDLFVEPMQNYIGLADEVIVVDGSAKPATTPALGLTYISSPWPREFSWEFIGQQFQKGYEAATGDWVIHADLDFIFHELDFDSIRYVLEANADQPAMSFYKYKFIQPDRYNLKARLVIAVNKKEYGDRIKFDSGGDLCQPSLDGEELTIDKVKETRIGFFNYEKLTKTGDQIRDDVGRMARAWTRRFNNEILGGPDDTSAYLEWLNMVIGRWHARNQKIIGINSHPQVIRDTIRTLRPDQFGYNGFGRLENTYF